MVDSIYQKSYNVSRKNSIDPSIKLERQNKNESVKNKTINSTAAESKNLLVKSFGPIEQ